MSELPPPTNEYPYDFADQSDGTPVDTQESDDGETTPDEEPKTLAKQAKELQTEAEKIGLPPKAIAQLIHDFMKEHDAANNPEASNDEERSESDDGAPESPTSKKNLEQRFDDIGAALENADKALGNVEGGLEKIAEVLEEFFDKLIELFKQLELYLNKIANTADELEKRRLVKELQDVINKFGQNGISANAVQPTDSMPAAA